MGVGHYENFPVASLLCPAPLRPAVAAIYHFARTADDIADEGQADPATRLAELEQYRRDLDRALDTAAPEARATEYASASDGLSARWPRVFGPLAHQVRAFALPGPLLHALLDAFEQDVRNPLYPDRGAVLDYCARSANPVGRLLLHLYGIADAQALQQSDAVCTALQLINFWQDLGRDAAAGRCYVPAGDLEAFGLRREDLASGRDTDRTRALVAQLCDWAQERMLSGAPLALRVPGRAGWELRLVVQGGLRVLERIRRMDHATLSQRPTLGGRDLPPMLWRAWRMAATSPARR